MNHMEEENFLLSHVSLAVVIQVLKHWLQEH